MTTSTEEFVHHGNVTDYQRGLRDQPSAAVRESLLKLLSEEARKAKEAGWASSRGV